MEWGSGDAVGGGRLVRLSVLVCVAFVLATATPATSADPIAWNATSSAGLAQISESTASLPVYLDGDGHVDLIWNRHAKQTTQLFYNDGFGHFTERFAGVLAARVDRHQCAAADVDRNGHIDVYCVIGANYGTAIKANELWMQQATGGFVNKATRVRGPRPIRSGANGDLPRRERRRLAGPLRRQLLSASRWTADQEQALHQPGRDIVPICTGVRPRRTGRRLGDDPGLRPGCRLRPGR